MSNSFLFKLGDVDCLQTHNAKIYHYVLNRKQCGKYTTDANIRFCSIITGEHKLYINDEEMLFKQNEFLILPSYSNVYFEVLKHTNAMIYEIPDSLVKDVYDSSETIINFLPAIENPISYYKQKYSETIFEDVCQLQYSFFHQHDDPYLAELLLRKLIYHLFKTKAGPHIFSIKAKHPMEQVAFYIKRKANTHLNLGDVADKFGMSISNFSHTFKTHFGVTPKTYLNSCKLELATEMLKDSTVTEVTFLLGYESISSFIRQFKAKYNVTPKQFQLSYKHMSHKH